MIDSVIGSTRSVPLYVANSSLLEAVTLVDIDAHNVAGLSRVPVNNGVVNSITLRP